MPKFIVDLWLDGYETEAEMIEACRVFILDQLSFSGSGVEVELVEEVEYDKNPTGGHWAE